MHFMVDSRYREWDFHGAVIVHCNQKPPIIRPAPAAPAPRTPAAVASVAFLT
jgi:hypothetical protein